MALMVVAKVLSSLTKHHLGPEGLSTEKTNGDHAGYGTAPTCVIGLIQ